MKLIDNFHWKYIVGGLSKRWRKASSENIPEPLRIFFMNYANEIAERCKDTLLARLEQSTRGEIQIQAESLSNSKFGLIVNQLSNILYPQSSIKKHDDFLLIFDHLIDKERKSGNWIEKTKNVATDVEEEEVLLSFKVKDPEGAWAIQRICRQELRPIYRETVLPVMRLISLGYGKAEKRAREDVAGSELIKNWYAITQLCQLVLPVNFYLDRSLQTGQAKALTEEEARELIGISKDGPPADDHLSSKNLKIGIYDSEHLADKLASATNEHIVKQVKTNLKSRGHIYRRILRNVFYLITGKFKSKLKNLFISKKVGEKKFVVESGDDAVEKVQSASEMASEMDVKNEEDVDADDAVEEVESEVDNDKSKNMQEHEADDTVQKIDQDEQKVELTTSRPGFFKRNKVQLIVGTVLVIAFGVAAAFVVYLFYSIVVTLIGVGASLSTISFG